MSLWMAIPAAVVLFFLWLALEVHGAPVLDDEQRPVEDERAWGVLISVEVPDPQAVAAAPKVTVEEEIVEWVCPPSLLSSNAKGE